MVKLICVNFLNALYTFINPSFTSFTIFSNVKFFTHQISLWHSPHYLNVVHRAVKKLESVKQITDRIESEIKHGANITALYLSPKDIQITIRCIHSKERIGQCIMEY